MAQRHLIYPKIYQERQVVNYEEVVDQGVRAVWTFKTEY
jgi:hypothetical protein